MVMLHILAAVYLLWTVAIITALYVTRPRRVQGPWVAGWALLGPIVATVALLNAL